jgi:hypothetical protein
MNIILRPGAGDKTKALPKPQVKQVIVKFVISLKKSTKNITYICS